MIDAEIDRVKPVRFPMVWLTYKVRIRRDLDRAFAAEGGETFFSADYLTRMAAQAKQLDEWLIKLFVVQITLTGFQVVGFVVPDASVSLFGITLKQASGVKEILISFYCLIAVATWITMLSRDTAITVLERAIEITTDAAFIDFGKLATPTPFGTKIYVPRAYEDWIFPTRLNTAIFWILSALSILLYTAIFCASVAINAFLFMDIYRHPTLGTTSYWVLSFVGLTLALGILFITRFYLPQPYRDQSVLQDLRALEHTDPGLYRRKRAEIYGPQSRLRKYTWSFLAQSAVTKALNALSSVKHASGSKIRSLLHRLRRGSRA